MSVLDTWNVYSFLVQSSSLRGSMPATEIHPATEDHMIIEEMAQNTDVKTIGTLQQIDGANLNINKMSVTLVRLRLS